MKVIGRQDAKDLLKLKLKSKKADLVAVIGRRRIGKTFLIKHFLSANIIFRYTGLYKGTMKENLNRFSKAISSTNTTSLPIKTPSDWFEAFDMLQNILTNMKSSNKKKVIFLDEFPWMATNRSRFLTAFTDFWNSFAADQNNLMVIICGSSASWMINKVLRNKGGLHNRVTERIFLEPFTLKETKEFLMHKNIILTEYDIAKLYMAVGGVPFYLDQFQKGESVAQSIHRICFTKNALLKMEYNDLMASLFDNSEKHQKIIEILNSNPNGLLRNEIINKSSLTSGGGTTSILTELETSGFIKSYIPYLKKNKDKIYKISDPYLSFYFRFIKDSKDISLFQWNSIFSSSKYASWAGLAFENLCLNHINEIKKNLKIDGIITTYSSWHSRGDEDFPGAQIDLLIDRADNIINLCEIKFYNSTFTITKSYAAKIRQKISVFKQFTGTKKAVFPTIISTFGTTKNLYYEELIQQEVILENLFQ